MYAYRLELVDMKVCKMVTRLAEALQYIEGARAHTKLGEGTEGSGRAGSDASVRKSDSNSK